MSNFTANQSKPRTFVTCDRRWTIDTSWYRTYSDQNKLRLLRLGNCKRDEQRTAEYLQVQVVTVGGTNTRDEFIGSNPEWFLVWRIIRVSFIMYLLARSQSCVGVSSIQGLNRDRLGFLQHGAEGKKKVVGGRTINRTQITMRICYLCSIPDPPVISIFSTLFHNATHRQSRHETASTL